jgi:hypothetical protein
MMTVDAALMAITACLVQTAMLILRKSCGIMVGIQTGLQ